MVNNAEFSKRLKKVLEYYHLSASAFAEKIAVQRSSISHLLSGRNKPSLDFVLKVLKEFDEVELYWLLNGKGSFPKKSKKEDFPSTLFSDQTENIKNEKNPIQENSTIDSEKKETTTTPSFSKYTHNSSEIDKIIIFYKNGTFKLYNELN